MAADVSQILDSIDRGDPAAAEKLLPIVYDELREMAAQRLSRESKSHTLQATALVHEAYLRLARPQHSGDGGAGDAPQEFQGRAHFFAVAAEAMRRVLIDRARAKQTVKRARPGRRIELAPDMIFSEDSSADLVELDDALRALAQVDPSKARLVTLRFFGGMTVEEAAALMGISRATAERLWSVARAWLYREMMNGRSGDSGES